jgi:hypothetical protein
MRLDLEMQEEVGDTLTSGRQLDCRATSEISQLVLAQEVTLNGRRRYFVNIWRGVCPVSMGEMTSFLPSLRSLLVLQSKIIGAFVSGRNNNAVNTTTA